ncbi:MAG: hypothetical protein IJZ88_00960 [Clostridia bacterium]|nr:hypothetical protein [Clostridia bacterium]
MAYVWEVTEALSLLTDITQNEKETSETICRHCLEETLNLLRPDANQSDPRIVAAAAARAFYNLCIKRTWLQEESKMTSFKAGDLSVSYDSASVQEQLNSAKEIRDKAMLELTPLIADNGFYFGKVDIYD